MGSSKRLLRPETNLSRGRVHERLLHLVAGTVRFGRNIKLHQPGSIPRGSGEMDLLRRYVDEIRSLRGKKTSTKKLNKLLAKTRVVASVLRDGRYLGRKPTIYQVVAARALRSGLDSPNLLSFVAALRSVDPHQAKKLWEGTASNILTMLRFRVGNSSHNLPSEIESLLRRREQEGSAREMSSKEIAASLGMEWNERVMNNINCAMQLLEVCKLVKKLPPMSLQVPLSMWAHAQYHSPKIKYPNIGMYLLQQLHEGPKDRAELYKAMVVPTPDNVGIVIGNPKAVFGRERVVEILDYFAGAGIAKAVVSQKVDRRGIPHNIVVYRLTKQGKSMYRDYLRKGHLTEGLRLLLLGEREAVSR